MSPNSKSNLALILIAIIIIIISLTSFAFGELFFETDIKDNVLTITGFTDDEYVGIALKNSQGMMLQTARAELDALGSFTIEMIVPYPSGFYQLVIGSSENHESIEIYIGQVIDEFEEEVIELPYSGQVAPATIETPELEVMAINGIPDWIRSVFVMWVDGYIDDIELIASLEYLIKQGIIQI